LCYCLALLDALPFSIVVVTGLSVIERFAYSPPGVRFPGRPVHDTSGIVQVPGSRTHNKYIGTSVGLLTVTVPDPDEPDASHVDTAVFPCQNGCAAFSETIIFA